LNCWPVTTQLRAFLWSNGFMRDLGTLGGNDAAAYGINDAGQVMGVSFTNAVPNGTTGIPTQDPFFWDNGHMVDIGTLGGTVGYPYSMNSRGQVVGQSNLAGDGAFHAFLWDRGRLTDLGTLGGTLSIALWVNDAGEAAGVATTSGDLGAHGVLWKNGRTIDLGNLPGFPRSTGISINSREQIAGNVFTDDLSVFHAMLWQVGEIIDLNAYVSEGSGITLTQANVVNERGEIYVQGILANGDAHLFLLRPAGGCDQTCEQRIRDTQLHPKLVPTGVPSSPRPPRR
jgi:probable HAF family extracellular repeat protein